MEKNMETIMMGDLWATIRIHSFISCYPEEENITQDWGSGP